MLTEGLLPLIPSVYVDNSLLTAVLLGVLILFFLGERFGWPQSGLVVPGYLAGILVVAPEVALVIGIEALLTFGLAKAVIAGLPKIIPIDRAFGRDRFFLILLLSVGVRLFIEAGPGVSWLETWGLGSTTPLHSVGLVLVPLTANALWMPGFIRGVPLVLLPVFGVFLLLNNVLLPWTNLNLSHFAFSVESISQDFLTTPHTTIVLLVGCALGARLNLRFGWEFGGILVPGLLAIAWADPSKVFATFAEVIVTVAVLRLALRTPPFRRMNLGGLRPLVLAFVLAYFLKLALAWQLGESIPGFRAHELFGFGYLLPALLAVRCWKRGSLTRILVPTAAASLLAFFLGSGLSMALSGSHSDPGPKLTQSTTQRHRPAWESMVKGAVAEQSQNPALKGLLEEGLQAAFGGQPVFGHGLRVDAHSDGMILHGGNRLAIGRLWVRDRAENPLVLIVPKAGQQAGLAEAGVGLAKLLDAEGLALSPAPALSDLLNDRMAVLQVQLGEQSRLRVKGNMPSYLDIQALRRALPELTVEWQEGEETVLHLELALDSVLELALRHFNAPVHSGRLPLQAAQIRPARPVMMSTQDLASLDRGVMKPLLAGLNGPEEWTQLAAWHAKALGLDLQVDAEVYSLGTSSLKAPPHWALWLRRGPNQANASPGIAIEVPSAGRHFRTLRVGRTWWEATQATALLVHNAKADPDSTGLQQQGVFAPEAIILRRLALDQPGLHVFSAAAFFQYENPGVDAVLSDGRPALDGTPLSPAFERLKTLIARGGGHSLRYSGKSTELRFHDSQNGRRRVVELAGGTYIKAYLSPTHRLSMGPLTDSPSLRAALASAEIPLVDQAFQSAWEETALSQERIQAEFAGILNALERYGRSGHPGELARIRSMARRKGLDLSIRSESDEALPYLHAKKGRLNLLAPLCNYTNGNYTRERGGNYIPEGAGAGKTDRPSTLQGLREAGMRFGWRTP